MLTVTVGILYREAEKEAAELRRARTQRMQYFNICLWLCTTLSYKVNLNQHLTSIIVENKECDQVDRNVKVQNKSVTATLYQSC